MRLVAYELLKSHLIVKKHLTLCILPKKLASCNGTLRGPFSVTILRTVSTWGPWSLFGQRDAPSGVLIVAIHKGYHAWILNSSIITQKAHTCLDIWVSVRHIFTLLIQKISIFTHLLSFLLIFLNVDFILSWHDWEELANSLVFLQLVDDFFISHEVDAQMLVLNEFWWCRADWFVTLSTLAFLFLTHSLMLFHSKCLF